MVIKIKITRGKMYRSAELRRQRKLSEIELVLNGGEGNGGVVCRGYDVDLWKLRELCLTGGGLVDG